MGGYMDKNKRYRHKQVIVKIRSKNEYYYEVTYLDGSVTYLSKSEFHEHYEEIPENEEKPVEKKVRHEGVWLGLKA